MYGNHHRLNKERDNVRQLSDALIEHYQLQVFNQFTIDTKEKIKTFCLSKKWEVVLTISSGSRICGSLFDTKFDPSLRGQKIYCIPGEITSSLKFVQTIAHRPIPVKQLV